MNALQISAKAPDIDSLKLELHEMKQPPCGASQCVVAVKSAGVNMSDVKAALGGMPHAVWPRAPGRDYAGIVVDGPKHLLGKEVWGSGGELGIRRNGTHGAYVVVETDSVRPTPKNIGLLEAGAVGVPFVTAYEGFRRAGVPSKGDVVLVCGANGKVGQAATQLATRMGARVIGVDLNMKSFAGHSSSDVHAIDGSTENVSEIVLELTKGKGANIVFNTVGSPYFEHANKSLAKAGTQIFISTFDRSVPFDIFSFYRGQHTYVGIDTLALDSLGGAKIFDQLAPGFEDGSLRPFKVSGKYVFSLADAAAAYKTVFKGAKERVVLTP